LNRRKWIRGYEKVDENLMDFNGGDFFVLLRDFEWKIERELLEVWGQWRPWKA
jgi:hypothetical protein